MCLACVMRPGPGSPTSAAAGRGLADWTAGDLGRAETVYRQLPRWSRLLFDALSASPAREHARAELCTIVLHPDDPFDIEDVCGWAADFCTAAGRIFPVTCMPSAGGESQYRMEETAARLFRELAGQPAAGRGPDEPAARPGSG